MSALFTRTTGVLTSPRQTLAAVAGAPRWLGVLILTTLVTFACGAVLFETDIGQTALVDQWERTAIAFGGDVGDTEYARLQDLSRQGLAYAAFTALMSGPVMTAALAALLWPALRTVWKTPLSFRQILALVAHANIVLAVRQLVTTPLQFATETLANPLTAVRLAGAMNEASPLARFLGAVDPFVVWWLIVLAIGVGSAVQRPARPFALTFTGIYLAVAIAVAVTMAIAGGTA